MVFTGLSPWLVAALAAGSAGILVVLHMLRIRPRRVRVITTLFWSQAAERSLARTLFRRFRHPWTFVLLLMICALLSLALGQPGMRMESPSRVWQVFVLDCGMSMAAPLGDNGGTRLDEAKTLLLQWVSRLSLQDHVAVIVTDPWPRLVQRFNDPRPVLRKRLARLVPADVPGARADALHLADSLLYGRQNARVTCITDRPIEDLAIASANTGVPVQVVQVGRPADNAAILSASFEPLPDNPLQGQVSVQVGYWGRGRRTVGLAVRREDGTQLVLENISLVSGQTHLSALPTVPADGSELTIELMPEDGVPADNVMRFPLPARCPIRVGTDGHLPVALSVLLESDPAVQVVASHEERDVDVLISPDSAAPGRPAILVHDDGPRIHAGRLVGVLGDSPLVRGLDFENGACGSGAALSVEKTRENEHILLTADDAVLAALSEQEGDAQLHLASALVADDADALHRPAFAIFLTRALRHLAGWVDPVITVPAERLVDDPLCTQRLGHDGLVAVVPGSRHESDQSQSHQPGPQESKISGRRWSLPESFEVLIALALVLMVLEGVLHARGRIP